jgi:hypothetical protein
MKAKGALTLIALFLFCILADRLRIESGHANNSSDSAVEQANAKNLQSSSIPVSAREKAETKRFSIFTAAHVEPLVLLLFGSTLLLLGTFINLMLSRRMRAKSMPGAAASSENHETAI